MRLPMHGNLLVEEFELDLNMPSPGLRTALGRLGLGYCLEIWSPATWRRAGCWRHGARYSLGTASTIRANASRILWLDAVGPHVPATHGIGMARPVGRSQ